MVSVRLVQAEDRQRWTEFVKRAPDATQYHQIAWKDVIEKSFKQRAYYWMASNDAGEVTGVLPAVRLKSVFFGDYIVSLPYFTYGGPCAVDSASHSALVATAIETAKAEGVAHIEFRCQQPQDMGLVTKTSKVSMRLDLPGDSEVLWKSFTSKLRSQIQRPLREGMRVALGKLDLLDDFYQVFSINMRDLGTPVYPKRFFENMLQTFPETTSICAVYAGAKPVAAGFLIGFNEMLEIPWASSLRDYNRYSPNMILYWTVLKFACEHGYRVFDFGRSTPDEGTYRFKAQWGARPIPLYWHYWMERGNELPELNPHNPRYAMAIWLWKRLPVSLTKWIGPSIVKNLP
jgi:FemAB-related protein (PEP-CTERM system-associated)